MSTINEILEDNAKFVENKSYENYVATKYPHKKIAILSCMDARLIQLLPAAMNIKNGDAIIIKIAGPLITNPFDSVMKSLIVSIYQLGIEQILVINHNDCGMQGLKTKMIIDKMLSRGINPNDLEFNNNTIDINSWLEGFSNPYVSVKQTVDFIKNHPLIPRNILVSGFVMHSTTGKLEVVE